MKKKALIIVFLMFLFAGINAQITGIYNFYTNNLFYFSPAHAGDKEQFASFMDYREHLSNLVDPIRTGMFGIHSPITKKMNLGGIIKTDRMGLYETVSARLDYAFRTKIANDHTLAFGINGGGMQRNLNYTDAVVFDPGDPTLLPDYAKSYIWFAGASLNYRFKYFNFDFAIPVLYKTTQNFYQNYWTFLSYNIYTKSQKWMFQPSVALNYNSGKQFGYQANLMINYYDVFWFQPTYKANNSLAFSAGVNLKKFGIAYAYETNSSSLAAIGGPSHEIMLSYGLYKPKIQPEDTVNAYQHDLKLKIGDKTYEEYISSDNYGFYGSIINLTDSLHKEEVKRDSIKTLARIDSMQTVYRDSMEIVRKDSIRKYTLRHLSDLDMNLLEKGVHFDLGSASLTLDSRKYLDEVAQLIKTNTNIRVLITGHTCDLGTEEANLRYSIDRAEAVKYYLLKQGVDPGRISTDSKLDAEPIVPNTNEENRKMNRRVSFSIIRE